MEIKVENGIVEINVDDKKIYDITGKRDIKADSVRTNNGNFVSDQKYLDIGLANYSYNNISNFMRVKFNNLNDKVINIISNGVMSYYYDTVSSKFVFKVNNTIVSSNEYKLEERHWYILGYTYNKNEVKFYIDGKLISSANIDLSILSKILEIKGINNGVSSLEPYIPIICNLLTNNG